MNENLIILLSEFDQAIQLEGGWVGLFGVGYMRKGVIVEEWHACLYIILPFVSMTGGASCTKKM